MFYFECHTCDVRVWQGHVLNSEWLSHVDFLDFVAHKDHSRGQGCAEPPEDVKEAAREKPDYPVRRKRSA